MSDFLNSKLFTGTENVNSCVLAFNMEETELLIASTVGCSIATNDILPLVVTYFSCAFAVLKILILLTSSIINKKLNRIVVQIGK